MKSLDTYSLVLLGVYAVASAAALMLLRHHLPLMRIGWHDGEILSRPAVGVAAGAFLYIASFLVWLVVLARTPVATAYPLAIGLSMVLTAVGASYFLGEAIRPIHVAGMLLVLAGVALLVRS